MTKEIKTINQEGVSALLKERLERPDLYAGKPLLLWGAYWDDGFQPLLVRKCILAFNEGKEKGNRKWFYFNPNSPGVQKGYTGLFLVDTSIEYPENFDMYHGAPLIVYAMDNIEEKRLLSDLPHAEQYRFQPDFRQWADEVKNWAYPYSHIVDFFCKMLRVNPQLVFGDSVLKLTIWDEAIRLLKFYLIGDGQNKLSDLTEDQFISVFPEDFSSKILHDFYEYTQNHKI